MNPGKGDGAAVDAAKGLGAVALVVVYYLAKHFFWRGVHVAFGEPDAPLADRDYVDCPSCNESIPAEARKCSVCGEWLPAV